MNRFTQLAFLFVFVTAIVVQARAAVAQQAIRRPFPQLSTQHQKYLDKILQFWEHHSNKIERYRCHFKRWEYDMVFGPKHTYKTYSEGVINYEAPDKGMFKVEKVAHYTPPQQAGQEATYVVHGDRPGGEHWMCDGKSIFEFDYRNKRLVERRLPRHLQGKAITEGPLPFLFGAKADTIKSRYWMRVITPKEAKGEYWLEAYPRSHRDAQNFKKIEIIIAEKDFLPKAIQLFDRNYDPHRNPSRTVFMFDNREVNWSTAWDKINLFKKAFHQPALPDRSWTKVVEDYEETAVANQPAAAPPRR